jgi:hypothetical protein
MKVVNKMKKIFYIPVDIYNQFCYNNNILEIDKSLEQYKVINPPSLDKNGLLNYWTNESTMDSILVIEDRNELIFLDQNGLNITEFVIKVV